MLLIEPIEKINQLLERFYGAHDTGRPYFRVVWSEDQFEKRLTDYTDSGLKLLTPEVRELPKYRQWIKAKYVLEGLTVVPEVNANELPTNKLSYEPIWVFQDENEDYLPPRFEACKFILDSMKYGRNYFAKYSDPDSDPIQAMYNKEKRVKAIEEELYGDKSTVSDALHYKEGVFIGANDVDTSN